VPERYSHLFADFVDVPAASLGDSALISGLLIAAAGAAGFSPIGAPIVRQLPNGGVTGFLLLDGCHVAVHTFPHQSLLLLDVLSRETQDPRKALDAFARRVAAREIRSDVRTRG
jgi:S-adenosylmethionine/arginine decarboxylase-like enzyme